jgi:hypothetical protein
MTMNDLIAVVTESKQVADDLIDLFDFEDEEDQWALSFIAAIKELGFEIVKKNPGGFDA